MDFDKTNLFNFEYVTNQGLAIDCWVYYEKGEGMTYDYPGDPDTVHLEHACVGGIDIIEVMDQDMIYRIEEQAAEEMGNED